MTARILAVYDGSMLGNLAVESALQFACSKDSAVLHVLVVPATPGDAEQREALIDDLTAFVRLGQRLGVSVDGGVIKAPDPERIATEIRQRQIDHLFIAKPAVQNGDAAISRILDAAAAATGITTTVVSEEDQ